MSGPKRIQRKRMKGWKMPPNTVYVGRPTKWGNPFRVWDGRVMPPDGYIESARAVDAFRNYIENADYEDDEHLELSPAGITSAMIRDELRGKDLACWCPIGEPCHADVLLEIANESSRVRA